METAWKQQAAAPPVALLLGERLAGAAQLFGEVLELGEAIFHAQHGRLVIDVHPGPADQLLQEAQWQ